jgi:chemotaxis protein methyltransferase CheR
MSTLAARPPDEYVAFCQGIRRLTGIDLLQYKRGQMERRIRSFARRHRIEELPEYLAALGRDRALLDELLDRVTINVSQLWRNPEQWERLRRDVIPELAAAGRIHAWSAGCSYGAEAYTLAAICTEEAPGARIHIRGTDIDKRMVRRAAEGRFSAEDARTAPRASLERWFEPDAATGGWRARRELRSLVHFETGDVLRDRFPPSAYDLVLCRNVVIYFTEDVRDDLHARLATTVRQFGYLMIGSSERVATPSAIGLLPAHPFIYRRI